MTSSSAVPSGATRRRSRRPGRPSDRAADRAAAGGAAARAARRAALPPVTYPAELPVSQRKDEIARVIRDHQVVVIAGETGSGKTTQIPKICLELGRGIEGQIGHTQPRRLAARTVAERIAEELGSPLGEAVGYQVRFTDVSARDTLVKLMTDGILLNELARDRDLSRYDTLIIDEAHERSLNIDFILGYLRQLLPRRPDLKVIITSATIDPERFAAAFGGAPIVEVSGRTYPVETRYRPLDEDGDQGQAISDAIDELSAEGPGDILVFLSGEREIRDTADLLSGRDRLDILPLEVLPLYGRLSAAEQHRVFDRRPASSLTRRVVLATNVAETSLTVPGIKYVIDPGTARISRYSRGTKVQRLPIEPISQASANQRQGRCGRTSDGICIRLYSRGGLRVRPEFTDPEILRTNLASVILQMAAIGLGDVPKFPFIDPPDARNIADGLTLLAELNAFKNGRITGLGRKLARLPVDPRIGRMILEADRNGCVREVLIIAAALSIQDPRERPAEVQQAADDKHRRFADPDSDFVTFLNLWDYLAERQRELSSSAFRRLCRAEFLNYLRVREWQDLQGQLQRLAGDLGVTVTSTSAERTRLHVSLLAGLLSQIGMRINREAGPRPRRGALRDDGTPAAGRVSRCPQRAVRDLPRLRPDQEGTGLDRGRRAGGDVPAMGADGGAHRARVGRAAGPAPGQAQLQRAALGEETGRGGRAGEGDPVRGAAGDGPQGPVRAHRPGGGTRAVHQARAGGRRLADQPPVLRREPAAAGRGRGGRAPGQAPRPGGRRGRAVRVLRRADPGRGGLGPALRHLVEAGPPGRPGPAHLHGRRPAQRGRRRGQRRRLSRRLDLARPPGSRPRRFPTPSSRAARPTG